MIAHILTDVGLLYFGLHSHTMDYFNDTILDTAKSIKMFGQINTRSIVTVDGLPGRQKDIFATQLRRMRIRVEKVRGVRDEFEELIRLADSVCGFVREALFGTDFKLKKLFKEVISAKVLRKLK